MKREKWNGENQEAGCRGHLWTAAAFQQADSAVSRFRLLSRTEAQVHNGGSAGMPSEIEAKTLGFRGFRATRGIVRRAVLETHRRVLGSGSLLARKSDPWPVESRISPGNGLMGHWSCAARPTDYRGRCAPGAEAANAGFACVLAVARYARS